MSKFFYILLILLSPFFFSAEVSAQMQAAHWFFGNKGEITFPFGNAIPNISQNNSRMLSQHGSSSYSDINGNLIVYTNGQKVFDHLHQEIIPRGFEILGNHESTQSSIIVPIPNHRDKYYLFVIRSLEIYAPLNIIDESINLGLNYYIIDLSHNNRSIIKPDNNILLNRSSQKLAATYHHNQKDIWVLTHFENRFYSYLITSEGIHMPIVSTTPYWSKFDGYYGNAKGQMKFSSNGKKLAVAHQNNVIVESVSEDVLDTAPLFLEATNESSNHPGRLFLYEFDPITGQVSEEYLVEKRNIFVYNGIEFSPSGKYLYYQGANNLVNIIFQFNTENLYKHELYFYGDSPRNMIGDMQLAVNGKIYYTDRRTKLLSVINYPEKDLNEAQFLYRSFNINEQALNQNGLPNFISNFLKEELKIYNTFDGDNACIHTPLKFWVNNNQEILSIFWDFGDGNTSEEHVPEHIYTNPGIYTITVTINGQIYKKTIQIYDTIDLPVYEMVECDTNGDGIAGYHLENFTTFLGEQAAHVSYHSTQADAQNNRDALENLMIQGNAETPSIWARIINKGGCISITEIRFKLNEGTIIDQTSRLCASFDNVFFIRPSDIQSLYHQSVYIFETHQEAENFQNHITDNISLTSDQTTLTLFVRQQNFEGCDEIIALQLNINYPTLFSLDSREICPFEGETIYTLPDNIPSEHIQWNNLQGEDLNQNINGRSIRITKAGNYSVTVTNESGCQFTSTFEVTSSSPIQVRTIVDQNSNLIIDYGNQMPNDFEFSIDEGTTWNNGTTIHLPLGEYWLWIRQKGDAGCIVYTEKIISNKITNFISPNGDGINDVWQIKGFEKYEWIDVLIYNRQGRQLFENRVNHSNILWDGRVHGKPLPSGSYWYTLKTSTHTIFEGYVVINNQN